MNPPASSFLGNCGAQRRAYASVLVGDTCGPLHHQLKEKASLPNEESRTGVHTATRMLSHLQDTWSCSSVCDHEGTGWPAAGGEQEDGKGLGP